MQKGPASATITPGTSSSLHPKEANAFAALQYIRKNCLNIGMSDVATDLMLNYWRPMTEKAYNTYIRKWIEFLAEEKIQSASYVDLANFLADLFAQGVSYSTINLARSSVSAYMGTSSKATSI